MPRGLALVGCLLLSLAFAASAQAAKEYEPNDTLETAYGPLAGGTAYTAGLETDNDVDWYVFYIKTYSQMDFSATMLKNVYYRDAVSLSLYDKNGYRVGSEEGTGFEAGYINVTNHMYLTMNPGRYYLQVSRNEASTGDRYRFRIDPAASMTTDPLCGEAIVAREEIGPVIAGLNQELAENTERLAAKTRAVKKAKKLVRRIQKRRYPSPGPMQTVRRVLRAAKVARKKVWDVQVGLQTAIAQQQQALAGAEAQIATYC